MAIHHDNDVKEVVSSQIRWYRSANHKIVIRTVYASCYIYIYLFIYLFIIWQAPRAGKIYILLTKREGRTGRISARGLDSTDRGPIFSQYGPEQAWLIRDLLHD